MVVEDGARRSVSWKSHVCHAVSKYLQLAVRTVVDPYTDTEGRLPVR